LCVIFEEVLLGDDDTHVPGGGGGLEREGSERAITEIDADITLQHKKEREKERGRWDEEEEQRTERLVLGGASLLTTVSVMAGEVMEEE
jgi:hypothetical protein